MIYKEIAADVVRKLLLKCLLRTDTVIQGKWFGYHDGVDTFDFIKMQFNKLFTTVDTALEEDKCNDYTVFATWVATDKNLYLVGMERDKFPIETLEDVTMRVIQRFSGAKYRRLHHTVHIEDTASGTGMIARLQQVRQTSNTAYTVKKAVKQPSKDKYTRVSGIVQHISSGQIYLPPIDTARSHNSSYMSAVCSPKTHEKENMMILLTVS